MGVGYIDDVIDGLLVGCKVGFVGDIVGYLVGIFVWFWDDVVGIIDGVLVGYFVGVMEYCLVVL